MNKFFVKTSAKTKEVLKTKVYYQGEPEKDALGLYTGSVEEYMPHGPGHLEFFNGSDYIGDFFEGKFHGKGVYTHSDGSRLQGTFENGEIQDSCPHVEIGNQIWMKENLNVNKFRNGDPILHARSDKEWEKAGKNKQPAWCYYDNDPENGKIYGRLYNWHAVNDPRGLAPEGWHVPSDDEWTQLSDFLGGEKVAGNKLKSKSGWNYNGNGSDNYSFSALPGGMRADEDCFYHSIGEGGYWLSSTEYSTKEVWGRYILHEIGNVLHTYFPKDEGFSVRCVRDIDYLLI